jgi:hypothetical protein
MDFKWIGWAGTVFLGLTIINSILGGALVSSTDVAILNQVGLTQKVDIGFMTLPVPNTNFISGLFHMISFDYSFFGGMGQLILFALYSVTFMIGFMLFITVIGLGINAIRGR